MAKRELVSAIGTVRSIRVRMLRALFPIGVCLLVINPYTRCTCEKSQGLTSSAPTSPAPSPTVPPPRNDGGECWDEPGSVLCVVQLCSDSFSVCLPRGDCYEGVSTPCGTEADASTRKDAISAEDDTAAPEGGSADASDAEPEAGDSGTSAAADAESESASAIVGDADDAAD